MCTKVIWFAVAQYLFSINLKLILDHHFNHLVIIIYLITPDINTAGFSSLTALLIHLISLLIHLISSYDPKTLFTDKDRPDDRF